MGRRAGVEDDKQTVQAQKLLHKLLPSYSLHQYTARTGLYQTFRGILLFEEDGSTLYCIQRDEPKGEWVLSQEERQHIENADDIDTKIVGIIPKDGVPEAHTKIQASGEELRQWLNIVEAKNTFKKYPVI